jgi:hypothetical protein
LEHQTLEFSGVVLFSQAERLVGILVNDHTNDRSSETYHNFCWVCGEHVKDGKKQCPECCSTQLNKLEGL